MSQPIPFPTVRPAEALKIIIADMPPGIARKVVRDALLGFSESDALEWRRMMEVEKKRRQRQEAKGHNVPMAPSTPSGQRVIVPMVSPVPSGQTVPSAPAPSPGPPSPPTPPPFIPQTPAAESLAASAPGDDEADAPPAAAGGGGKEAVEAVAKAARKADGERKRAVMLRLGKIHHRRDATEWSEKEVKKLKELWPHPGFLASVDEVEAYYGLPSSAFPRQERGGGFKDWRRKDLITLLNNWWGEVGLARGFFEANPTHKKLVQQPNGDPALSAAFLAWLALAYPSAVEGRTRWSHIHPSVRDEFRKAHPQTSITIKLTTPKSHL